MLSDGDGEPRKIPGKVLSCGVSGDGSAGKSVEADTAPLGILAVSIPAKLTEAGAARVILILAPACPI